MVLYGILAWASHDDALRREESGGGGGSKGSCKGSEGGGSIYNSTDNIGSSGGRAAEG